MSREPKHFCTQIQRMAIQHLYFDAAELQLIKLGLSSRYKVYFWLQILANSLSSIVVSYLVTVCIVHIEPYICYHDTGHVGIKVVAMLEISMLE